MSEQRTIMVANTKTQKRYKISTNASTLGELKQVLRDNGIDYADMAFTEGITKSVLTDDNAPLPVNIPYKGNTTNNLVLLLTNTSKKIASGISSERLSLYKQIKEQGLEQKIKEAFGRNFTQVSTDDLQATVDGSQKKAAVTGTVVEEADLEDCIETPQKTLSKEDIDTLAEVMEKLCEAVDLIDDLLFKLA